MEILQKQDFAAASFANDDTNAQAGLVIRTDAGSTVGDAITAAIAAIPATPDATTTVKGIVELATVAETDSFDAVRAVTPAGFKTTLALDTGAGLVGWQNTGAGAVLRTVEKKLQDKDTLFDYLTEAEVAAVEAGGFTVDVSVVLQQALLECKTLTAPAGEYVLSNTMELQDNGLLIFEAGTVFKQITPNIPSFNGTQKTNTWVYANRGKVIGEGTWSSSWTGQGGHDDRAFQFLGCTDSGVVAPAIENCGHSGVAILGGKNVSVLFPKIEGTHTHSTPLPPQANHQCGVYVVDHATYGHTDNVTLYMPDISGVAQGVLRENLGIVGNQTGVLNIVSPNIHDIPGQHALYIQGGINNISNPTFTNIYLSGAKFQGDASHELQTFSCTDVVANNLGGNMFEIAGLGGSTARDIILSGVGTDVGAGITVDGPVTGLRADITVTDVGTNAAYIFGDGAKDIDITVRGRNIQQDGVLITATNATGIKIRPTIRNASLNGPNGSQSGIKVESPSALVELFDPDVVDTNVNCLYGLFNSIAGSDIKVRGSAKFVGARDTAVRATGTISEFFSTATLQGTNGPIIGAGNITNVY